MGEAVVTLRAQPVDDGGMPSRVPGPPGPMHAATTVVLAQFDDLFTSGVRQLIEADPSLELVAQAVEHRRIPVVLRAHHPAVAILDADAFGKLVEIRALSVEYPGTRLVLLAKSFSRVEAAQMLAFGASACLGHDTQSRDVLHAIHLAARGLQLFPHQSETGAASLPGGQLLTRREADVLPLLQRGDSNSQIALALNVGVETIRTHVRHIYRKLGVASRRELVSPPQRQRAAGRDISARHSVPSRSRPAGFRSRRPGGRGAQRP
jgi:DNA-binding NarL/FixJ family response regulator